MVSLPCRAYDRVVSAPSSPAGRPALRIRGVSYPVFLPSWRDPRLHLASVIFSLHVLGQVAFNFRLSIPQILASILTCALLEVVGGSEAALRPRRGDEGRLGRGPLSRRRQRQWARERRREPDHHGRLSASRKESCRFTLRARKTPRGRRVLRAGPSGTFGRELLRVG